MKFVSFITDYIDLLMKKVVDICQNGVLEEVLHVPPPLSAAYDQPNKATLVKDYTSRYNR